MAPGLASVRRLTSLSRYQAPIGRAIRRRVLRATGLFLFHVNAQDDRPLRERARPVRCELEPDYVLEEAGQTVRFFSRTYLDDLLSNWQVVMLEHVEITHVRPRRARQERLARRRADLTGADR